MALETGLSIRWNPEEKYQEPKIHFEENAELFSVAGIW